VFGDTESGILSAIEKDATHLWANTILFADHPLQTSKKLNEVANNIRVVGQPPKLVELYDDKNYVNEILRAREGFRLPSAQLVQDDSQLRNILSSEQDYPVVAKPVRGRGSHGVKICRTTNELHDHCIDLLGQQSSVIIESYLSGMEGTVTVMPPSQASGKSDYWAMPVVERFNHADGIAPYNGTVAITENSRVVSAEQHQQDLTYGEIQRQCVEAARLLQCTAPIRIDIRRIDERESAPFALFDVNMKPVSSTARMVVPHADETQQNMTGPGRKGRENQASLTALAAEGIGWYYPTLLRKILESSRTLHDLRNIETPI
jgi:D-alanine-D-alanine ligase-like ATP-grasp enzyme